MAKEVDLTNQNFLCYGFELFQSGDDYLLLSLPPQTAENLALKNTLVQYKYLDENLLVVLNKFENISAEPKLELGFLQGLNQGADAIIMIAYHNSCTSDVEKCSNESEYFYIRSVRDFLSEKLKPCDKNL